ncbi:MAG: TRAP transporter large permease [Geminicoccaceae bacterium]|nr:MAG: TRAP transporter large permease [Geminicoccaceae bacterium]
MIDAAGALGGFAFLLILMFLGLPVGVAILVISIAGAAIFIGWRPVMAYGTQTWSYLNNFVLTAVPLFILLGELLLRAGLTEKMYTSLSDWVRGMPGRLLHTNVFACGLFSAVSGSSVATAATIGTVALKDFSKRGYNDRLVLGTIAAGATLGILIPPSINLIIYGAMTNTSIGRLFMAGVVPGLLLIGVFVIAIMLIAAARPKLIGGADAVDPLPVRLKRLRYLLPPLAIFVMVMATIYLGWGTPTEAAAVGVGMALVLAAANRRLSFHYLHEVFVSTVRLTAMILFILTAALFMNFIIGFLGVPRAMTQLVSDLGLTVAQTIMVLIIFYFVLGLFMEALAMMVATVPVIFPLIIFLGIDPIWFGIFLVLMMEVALITPPMGLNLYVVQGIRGRGSINDVFIGVIPFIFCMFVVVALIIAFPGIVTWLPNLMF